MWLVFAFGSVAATTLLGVLFRVMAVRARDSRAFAFAFNSTVFVFSMILLLLFGFGSANIDRGVILLLICSGIGYGLFQRYQFAIRKHVVASETPFLYAPTGIAGYLLALFWLGEPFKIERIFGYGLVLIAVFMILNKPKKFQFNKYVVLALLTGAGLSIAATIDRKVSQNFSSTLTYVTILWFFQALACYLPYVSFKKVQAEYSAQKLRIPILAAINLLALFCIISALKLAPATQVMPIANSNIIFITLAGTVFLNERERTPIKIIASLIAFAGLYLISR